LWVVDRDWSTGQLRAVPFFDGSPCVRRIGERYKAETAGPTGLIIRDHRSVPLFPDAFKRSTKRKLIGRPSKASDEQSLCHWFCLLLWGRRDADFCWGSSKVPAGQLNLQPD